MNAKICPFHQLWRVRERLRELDAQGSESQAVSIFWKSGVPRPVTGSQPGAAENPRSLFGPHSLLSPSVISFHTPLNALEYSYQPQRQPPKRERNLEKLTAGLAQPMEPLPAAIRASFTAVSIAANVGADADVPSSHSLLPSTKIWKQTLQKVRCYQITCFRYMKRARTRSRQRRGRHDRTC